VNATKPEAPVHLDLCHLLELISGRDVCFPFSVFSFTSSSPFVTGWVSCSPASPEDAFFLTTQLFFLVPLLSAICFPLPRFFASHPPLFPFFYGIAPPLFLCHGAGCGRFFLLFLIPFFPTPLVFLTSPPNFLLAQVSYL